MHKLPNSLNKINSTDSNEYERRLFYKYDQTRLNQSQWFWNEKKFINNRQDRVIENFSSIYWHLRKRLRNHVVFIPLSLSLLLLTCLEESFIEFLGCITRESMAIWRMQSIWYSFSWPYLFGLFLPPACQLPLVADCYTINLGTLISGNILLSSLV